MLPDATLVLAGTGEAEAGYRALANRLGVSDRVIFAGSLAHDDVPQWLAAADVMVLPSKSEGLANAWVESLACGTPIVICDAGGAAELLSDPVAGAIASAEPEALAQAVQAILAARPDPMAVRSTVAQFSWARNADELYRHFEAVRAGGSGRATRE